MAKAILIMDMPENCMSCKFNHNDYRCEYTGNILYQESIPDWCPLIVLTGEEEIKSRSLLRAIELEEHMQKVRRGK